MSELPCPYCGFNCEIHSNIEKIECPNCGRIFLYLKKSESHGTIDYRPSPEINDRCRQTGELKARFIDDTYVEYFNTGKHDLAQVYLKSEADKVIAEKDKEIKELKDKLRHYPMMIALLENDKNKIEELNAIHQKSLARLHELARQTYPDQEEDHAEADGILCDMLNALGYKDLTDAWDKIGKWYS